MGKSKRFGDVVIGQIFTVPGYLWNDGTEIKFTKITPFRLQSNPLDLWDPNLVNVVTDTPKNNKYASHYHFFKDDVVVKICK